MNSLITPPAFSVIVPVFNGEKYIGEALSSVFADSFDSFEVIVVDDGSTDNTEEIAKSFPGVKYYYQPNQGVAVAVNNGIGKAKGKYLSFLGSDDIWMPGRFARSFELLESRPDLLVIMGQLIMFLEEGCIRPKNIPEEWIEKQMDSAGTGVMTARHAVFKQVGLFNPSYRTGSDIEWLLRAKEMLIDIENVPILFLRRRLHDNNISNTGTVQAKTTVFNMIRESVIRKKRNEKQ